MFDRKLKRWKLSDCDEAHIHQALGLWYREGSGDERVLVEICGGSYAQFISHLRSDDVVLDIGANVGAFSRLALMKGISRVIAVEPDPTADELIARNAPEAEHIKAAVVGTGKPKSVLFQVNRTSSWANSLTYRRRDDHEVILVPVRSMKSLLREVKPTIVKMDIEGGEFEALDGLTWPTRVRGVTIEYHYEWCGYSDARERIERLHQAFLDQGFTCEVKEVYGLAELATYWR